MELSVINVWQVFAHRILPNALAGIRTKAAARSVGWMALVLIILIIVLAAKVAKMAYVLMNMANVPFRASIARDIYVWMIDRAILCG